MMAVYSVDVAPCGAHGATSASRITLLRPGMIETAPIPCWVLWRKRGPRFLNEPLQEMGAVILCTYMHVAACKIPLEGSVRCLLNNIGAIL